MLDSEDGTLEQVKHQFEFLRCRKIRIRSLNKSITVGLTFFVRVEVEGGFADAVGLPELLPDGLEGCEAEDLSGLGCSCC